MTTDRGRFAPSPGTHRHRVHAALDAGAPIDPTPLPLAERYLAGVATFADRASARALALVGDPSRRVRGIGFAVAAVACTDADAAAALRVAWSVRGERPLLARMSRRARTAAIDAFLDGLAADGWLRDLVDDLPFGSETCLRRRRPTSRRSRRASARPATIRGPSTSPLARSARTTSDRARAGARSPPR